MKKSFTTDTESSIITTPTSLDRRSEDCDDTNRGDDSDNDIDNNNNNDHHHHHTHKIISNETTSTTTTTERMSPKSVADFFYQEGEDMGEDNGNGNDNGKNEKQSKGEVTTENNALEEGEEQEMDLEECPKTAFSIGTCTSTGSRSESPPAETRRMKMKRNNNNSNNNNNNNNKNSSSLRQISRKMSKRLSEQFIEPIKPETKLGWTALCSTVASLLTIHEVRLQKKLTCPPLVYAQNTPYMNLLREKLGSNNSSNDTGNSNSNGNRSGILTKNIQPSLFVGTRSTIASAAAYALHHRSTASTEKEYVRFREIMRMDNDGATIALDWELPRHNHHDHRAGSASSTSPSSTSTSTSTAVPTHTTRAERIARIKYGPIDRPVVIILHGINNDASFGYMRSLVRACTNRGWIACGFNFRGCGRIPMTTPRGYNAGYTGDLRNVVHKIQSRLANADETPVFLVGNSLGANIITKYLGEEGFSRTLPKCVKGGVSLGNPLHIHSGNLSFPWNLLLGMGIKKAFIENWKSIHDMSSCIHFKRAVQRAMLAKTIGQLDDEMSPFLIRNESQYPFVTRVGYADGENYWHDSSSSHYVQHASVPLLILSSQDDFLVADAALRSLAKCLSNPNVLVVKTKCGGHLGWQEAPPAGTFGIVGTSWADTAMVDFFSSVLETGSVSNDNAMDAGATSGDNNPSTLLSGSTIEYVPLAGMEGTYRHMKSKL